MSRLNQPIRPQTNSGTKVYVTLRKPFQQDSDFKKLVLMISSSQMVYELKRKIEREYSELFPGEPPFVVSKIEDASGYALSNNS